MKAPEAPRDTVPVAFPTITGTRRVVRAGDNLQQALDKAQRGDEIVLDAGAVFTGNFHLPAKPGTGWIVIRGSQLNELAPGRRVGLADSVRMPRLVTTNSRAALATAVSSEASYYYLAGLDVQSTCCDVNKGSNYGILLLGDGSRAQSTLEAMPHDLVLDRMLVRGTTTSNLSRCVGYNAGRTAIVDSYLGECHGKGFDAQAIGGWNAAGPLRVSNTMLQGSGENVMLGGADPWVNGLIPSDLTFNRVYFQTPISWKGRWTKKNIFELKNAARVEVKNSIFSGSWIDAQTGLAWALKSVNQGGRCTWCATTDVWMHDNIVEKVPGLVNLAGHPDNAYEVGSGLARVLIEHTLMEDSVSVPPYVGDAKFVILLWGITDIAIRHNTLVSAVSPGGCMEYAVFDAKGAPITNLAFDSNIVSQCKYGFYDASGPGCASVLQHVTGYASIANNAIVGSATNAARCPPTNAWVNSVKQAEGLGARPGANRARIVAATAGVRTGQQTQ